MKDTAYNVASFAQVIIDCGRIEAIMHLCRCSTSWLLPGAAPCKVPSDGGLADIGLITGKLAYDGRLSWPGSRL